MILGVVGGFAVLLGIVLCVYQYYRRSKKHEPHIDLEEDPESVPPTKPAIYLSETPQALRVDWLVARASQAPPPWAAKLQTELVHDEQTVVGANWLLENTQAVGVNWLFARAPHTATPWVTNKPTEPLENPQPFSVKLPVAHDQRLVVLNRGGDGFLYQSTEAIFGADGMPSDDLALPVDEALDITV